MNVTQLFSLWHLKHVNTHMQVKHKIVQHTCLKIMFNLLTYFSIKRHKIQLAELPIFSIQKISHLVAVL